MHEFRFDPVAMPAAAEALRSEVRAFIAGEVARGAFTPSRNSWSSFDPDFSRKCGEQGYIGMRWPKQYGGHERSALERYVVTEEMLAGGAPVGAHWIADRQSGQQILRYGSERARSTILPRIAAGVCYFSIGMSEPDSGSDLAAVRTRASKTEGGWKISGTKVWTSGAHMTNYLIALARTAPKEDDRHAGLTQFIVDLSHPGVSVRPIYNLYGGHDFNEVVFDEFFVADDMVMGEPGMGWTLVTSELAFERSGPDRFLSTYQLLLESIRAIGTDPDARSANEIGRFVAHLATLRRMSISVAGMLERGEQPTVEAALVKDVGTAFEREIPETFRQLIPTEPSLGAGTSYAELLGMSILRAPGFTIRGGTREILRGMIARGLGLR
ncbi:MAG: acyl-CoA dehydrogenase family protein [Burkholderiales bacterium]|nr:acyl-CoA dehydrogenase family protein [Burkholderiales bacterium]